MNPNELKELIKEHRTWLDTDGKAGTRAHLSNVDLRNVDLSGAILNRAIIEESDFSGAYLCNTGFAYAELKGSKFLNTTIRDTSFYYADLCGTIFCGAAIEECTFTHANLSNSLFYDTHLRNNMNDRTIDSFIKERTQSKGELKGNDSFRAAKINKSTFIYSNMTDADWFHVTISESNFSGANFRGANMGNMRFLYSILIDANLKNANLKDTEFNKTNLSNVRYNRWGRYSGINIDNSNHNSQFKRFAEDQSYIEEFRKSKWRFPLYLLWLTLSDCGRSLSIWTGWSMFTAIIFGLKYFDLGPEAFKVDYLPWSKTTMIYYSVVTFTTLGFGDITPKNLNAAMWVMAEVVIGYIMLGGLIAIFANKLAKRS